MAGSISGSEGEMGGRCVGREPEKRRPGKGADGAAKVATTLIQRIPLTPQAVLTFFPDLGVEGNYPDFFEVHGKFSDLIFLFTS